MIHAIKPFILLCAIIPLISACSSLDIFEGESEPKLEGERISIMELQASLRADNTSTIEQITLPPSWRNEFWPQAGGYPNHAMQHLSLPETVTRLWKADIGRGLHDRIPLNAQPIVIGGLIITLDTTATLRAFDIHKGKEMWERNISGAEKDDTLITGGIAHGETLIFASNGENELIAVNPRDGQIAWRKTLPAPSQAAPTVLRGRIYVTTIDNRMLALNEADGTILWDYNGLNKGTGIIGSASPAANSEIVTPVFSSGEIAALRVENGSLAWTDNLGSTNPFGNLASISDIKALPILDKGLMIAVNYSGRMIAINTRTGQRVWQRDIGSANTPWVAGNVIYTLSSDNHLIALNRTTGLIYWVEKVPAFEKPKKRADPIIWQGPVLAGGRLILAGSNGMIAQYNPISGAYIGSIKAGKPIKKPPVVAGERLYVLSQDGTLLAYK